MTITQSITTERARFTHEAATLADDMRRALALLADIGARYRGLDREADELIDALTAGADEVDVDRAHEESRHLLGLVEVDELASRLGLHG
jgi:hypothetical protein